MMLGPKPGGKKDMKKAAKPGSSTPDHKGEDSSASEAEPATSSQKKEKPSSSKSHGSSRGESKATKRKLFMVSNILDEGDAEKKTPERKRKKTGDDASASTPSRPIPLSERQQLALIMQMTAAESGSPGRNGSPSGASNDRRSSEPSSAKKKNDKVNKRNERGETPLHMAAIKGDADLLRQLIKQGAEVNAKDFAGWTPLHEACNHGYYEVAKMLLQAGANVNTQGLDDDTPLHDAASNGHPHQIVELLLKHGADPLQANTKGKTPIDVAENETVERLLKSETIASSSDSSDSLDVKSPTSPESLASLNDETPAGKKSGDRERKHAEGNEFAGEELEHGGVTKPKETAERHRHPSKGEFSKSPARCSTKSPSNIFEKIEKISAIKKEADRRFAFESSDSDRSRSSTPEIRLSRLPKPREDGKDKTPRDKVKVLKTYSRSSSESRKDQETVERTEDIAKPSQVEAEVSEKHRHKQTLPERHFESDSEMEVSSVSSSVSRDESVERKESKKESKKEAKLYSDSNIKTPKLDGKHHDKGMKRKREEDATSSVGSSSTSCETKEKPSSEVKVKHKHLAKRSGIPGTMPDGTLKKKIKGDKIRDSEKREKPKHANLEGKKSDERRTKDLEGRSEMRKEKENEGKNSPQGGEIRRHSLPDLSSSTKKEKLKELKKMASLDKAEEGVFGRMLHSSHSKSKGDETKVKAETSRSDGHEAGTEKASEKHSKSEKAEKKLDSQERHSKSDKVEAKVHKGERSEGKISKGERSEDKSSKVDRSEEKRLKLEKAEKRHKSEHKSKEKGEHSQKVPHTNSKSDSIQTNSKSDSGKHKRKEEQKHHKIKSESSHSSDQTKVAKHKSDKLKPVNLERMKSSSSESLQSSTSSEVKSEKHSPKTEKLRLEKHKAELKAATLDRLKSSSSESLQSTDSFKGDRQKMKHHEGKGDGGKGSPQVERTSMDSPKVHRAQEKSVRSDSCNSERSGIESPATDKPREKIKSHKGEKSGHGHESPRTDKHREKERHRSGSSKESPVKDRMKEKHRTEHGKEAKKGAESPRDDKLFPWKTDRSGLDSPKRDKSKLDVTNKVDGSKVKEVTKVKHNSKGEKVKLEGSKRLESKPHSHNQDLFKPDKASIVKPEKLKTFDLFEGEITDKAKHLKIVRIPKIKKDSDKGDSLRPDKIKEGVKHELAAKSEHHKTDKEKLALKAEKSRGEGERKERVKLDGKDSHGDGSKPHKIKSEKHKGESSKHISSKSKSDKERLKVKEKRPESSTSVTPETPEKEKPAVPQKEERPTLSFPAIPSYLREEPETMKEKYIKVSPKTESIVTLEADLSEKPLPERSSLESKDSEDKFVEPYNKSPLGRAEIKETTLQLTPSVSLSPSVSFSTATTSSTVPKASITTVSTVISPVTVTTTTVSYTASTAVSSASVTVSSSSTTSSPSPVVRPPVVTAASVTSTFSSQTVATTSVPVMTSPALATTTTSSTMTFTSSKPQGVIAGPVVTQASSPANADYLKSLLLKPKVSQMIVSERPKVRDPEPTVSATVEESKPASREEPSTAVKEMTITTTPVVEPPAEKEKVATPSNQLQVKETLPKSQPTQGGGSLSNDSGPARSTTPQASIPVHVITPTPSSKPTEPEKSTQEIPAPTPATLPRKEESPILPIPPIGMVVSTSVTVSTPSITVQSKPEVKMITADIQLAATKESIGEPATTEAKTVPPGPSEVFISTSSSVTTLPVIVTSIELMETTVVTTVCVETSSSTNTSVALPGPGQPAFSVAQPAASLVRPPATSSPSVKQEEDSEQKPQRITRSMRSTSSQASTPPIPAEKLILQQEDSNSQMSTGPIKVEGQAASVEDSLENVHPFRRKVLKVKNIASLDEPYVRPRPEKPNPYWEYLNIRKVILERRQNMSVVIPKPPQCFDEYLLYQCSYLLHSSPAKSLIIPMYTPPASLPEEMTDLFVEQEKARHKIRLEHYLEREKLIMSCEQEILRVHCRAARAHANQSVPFSACKILLDEEVYNVPPEQRTEDKPQGRDRFTARQFHSWLQDVDEKYEAAKNCLLLRHHHEATSLQAVQKMEWQLRLQDLGYKDAKSLTDISDFYVPMVTVSEDFDLLPA